jgi:branched-chain amino acid transport system ATP-binding protein
MTPNVDDAPAPPAPRAARSGSDAWHQAPPLLEIENVSKHFGGVTALERVSLCIRPGEIYGLIGPNGAGKTTLFNCITGLYTPEAGRVLLAGEPVERLKAHQVTAQGVARTFQNIRLFANMTALENVMVGRHVRTRAGVWAAVSRSAAARAEETAIARRAHELLDYVGIGAHARALATHLSYGDQRRLEIARALATDPRLLALDEPAAGMNESETARLKTLLHAIRRDGVTVLIIEHDMKLMMDVCDRIAVLNFGKKIAEGAPAEIRCHPEVIAAYLGAGFA